VYGTYKVGCEVPRTVLLCGLFWWIRLYRVKIISVHVSACADYDFSALGLVVLAITEMGCVCLYLCFCEIFTGDATWCCQYDQEANHKISSGKTSASQNLKKSYMMKSHVKTVPTASCVIWGLFITYSSHKTKQSTGLII